MFLMPMSLAPDSEAHRPFSSWQVRRKSDRRPVLLQGKGRAREGPDADQQHRQHRG